MRYFTRETVFDDTPAGQARQRKALADYVAREQNELPHLPSWGRQLHDLLSSNNMHDEHAEVEETSSQHTVTLRVAGLELIFHRVRDFKLDGDGPHFAWLYQEILLMSDESIEFNVLGDVCDMSLNATGFTWNSIS